MSNHSRDAAKERLHLVLMQDRANVSADFLEMMKQEIIEVIKKYIDVDENSIDVKLTNKVNSDGTTGAPALYANIPIVSLKDETKKVNIERKKSEELTKSIEQETTETEKAEQKGELVVNEEDIQEPKNNENEEKIEIKNEDDEKQQVEEVVEEKIEEKQQVEEKVEPKKEEVEETKKIEASEKIEVE